MRNLALMPKYFPDWVIRVYVDMDPEHPDMKDLCLAACNSTQLDICLSRKLPGTPVKDCTNIFPMIWRYFPVLDPQVCDS